MTLTKRIYDLMQAMSTNIPEREFCIQLGFLTLLVGEPFYLYGRSGTGKSLVVNRLVSAFRGSRMLNICKRNREIPKSLEDYDIIVFQNFNPAVEDFVNNVQIALEDRVNQSIIVSGSERPEVALNRAAIMDKVTLYIALPERISSSALSSLLQNPGDATRTEIPAELTVTAEERKLWNENLRKVKLSEDTLTVIERIADVCSANDVYVPIRRWLALSNIIKATAFFNGRLETRLTDTFFLGGAIWGRSNSNATVISGYRAIVRECILRNIPDVGGVPYDIERVQEKIQQLLSRSNTLYETRLFNNEQCLAYRITLAGESIPLYVPLPHIETVGEFNPYNELGQVEFRVRCNYYGTSKCTFYVDSTIKGVGLRTQIARDRTIQGGKFEEFATLPAYILKENDPEIIADKRKQLNEFSQDLQRVFETETKKLLGLREAYRKLTESKNDLFCSREFYDWSQDQLKALFEQTANLIKKVKVAREMIAAHPF